MSPAFASLTEEERKSITRSFWGGQKDLLFHIAQEKVLNYIKMNANPPQSIPASSFKPRFDTSTLDGKIAVAREFKRVEYAYTPAVNGMSWALITKPHWDWDNLTYNFPTEPRTKIVPFTRETFPREAWVRFKLNPDYNFRVLSYSSDSFRVGDTIKPYDRAINDCELSSDNGKTWQPCGQVVEE